MKFSMTGQNYAKEKQPKRAKSKKPDGHLSERKIIQKSEI
jgi:hypothetical protein